MRARSHRRQMFGLLATLVLVLAAVVTTGVFYEGANAQEPGSAAALETITSQTEDAYAKGVVSIDLSDLGSVSGDGVKVKDNTLKIGAAGVYSLTGSLNGGQIEVDTKGKVYLELNGAQVTSSSGSALRVTNAKKLTLVLADGSTNVLADTVTGDADGATLSSNDSLYFTGTGSLTVTGNNSEAISCDDSIVVENGNITVVAAGDGLAANDDISINGGDVTATAKGDGLDSNGTLHVNGGSLTAFGGVAQGDGGVDVRGAFTITGGTVVTGGNLLAALSDDSRQTSVYLTSAEIHPGGTVVTLARNGQQVLSYTPTVAYENVFISSPDLTSGVTYQAYLGTKAAELVLASR